ncbi:MAG TPA: hypothetical protein VHC22_14700 [Pirellulales bacterium]|nr:hypothetical protein [Pirellulales bacterium]
MSILTEIEEPIAIEDGASDYRAVSALAVTGLVLGALSLLALENVVFCLISVVAVVVNWLALRKIHREWPALTGRPLALAGLALALIFGLSAPFVPLGYERVDRAQAMEAARGWFEALRENHPDVAHQWTRPRWKRVNVGESVPGYYAARWGKRDMNWFLEQPAVHVLLNLGKTAHVRYFRNVASETSEDTRTIIDVYAVTLKREQETISFFVQLTVTKRFDIMNRSWSWEVSTFKILSSPPDALQESGDAV